MMAKRSDFSTLVGPGTNPHGFRSVGPYGVGRGGIGGDYVEQWHGGENISGPRWNPEPDYSDEVQVSVPRGKKRR